MSTIRNIGGRLDGLPVDRETLVYAALVVNAEVALVLAYLLVVGPRVTRPLFYVYPFVWLNVAIYALWRVRAPEPAVSGARVWAARVLAAGYLLVLGYAGGLYGPAVPGVAPAGLRVSLASLPPGWSPALLYGGELFQFALLPFKVVGYATLAYLVYVTLLEATSGLVGGVLGLFSCVSCTLPVVAGVLSGVVGGAGAVATAAYGQSYLLSTVVFVLTVGLLLWRPTIADLRWPGGSPGERERRT